MDPQAKLTEVRRLITEAKNEEAASMLLEFLATAEEPQRSWRNTVSNLLAQYKRVRLQRERGVVGFDNARLTINQITDGLLAALAGIEEGRAPKKEVSKETTAGGKTPWLTIGVIVALVLAGVSFLMLRNLFNGSTETDDTEVAVHAGEVEAGQCPEYEEESQFNVLILPFLALDDKPSGIDRSIRIRLAESMEKYGVYGNVFTQNIETSSNDYPVTNRQAAKLARPCDAQLIIWGTTEEAADTDGYYTTTKFRFVESETFNLTNLEFASSSVVDTVSSLSSIATSAELTEEVEMTLRLIFGLVAHETQNYELAATLLDTVITERGGVGANPAWGAIQADSYIQTGEDEKAIKIYEEILMTKKSADPMKARAALYKGLLELRNGQTMEASKDLTTALEYEPDNETALTARAAASIRNNDLYQADQDLNKLEDMPNSNTSEAKRIREDYYQHYRMEKQKLEDAEKRIEENPSDTAAWRIKAQSAQHIGDFKQAEYAANTLLSVDPSSVAALNTLRAITRFLPDSLKLQERANLASPRIKQTNRNLQLNRPEGN
ncbi:MAG: hypothetical protein AAFN81_06200 [Bacteroidota bacterium]